jgi:pimeloyl-ACP methyl ester carboxylesterase
LFDVIIFGAMGQLFESEGLHLEYEIIGNGSKPLFAFHGFASNADMFRILEKSLGTRYTIYSFNLPFHGKSIVDEETLSLGIDPVQLKKYFKSFLWNIHSSYFSVLGYSIGGKVALKLIELLPHDVQDIFLFAPDGIKISPWYHFVTKTDLGKLIYRRMMKHPVRYMNLLGVLKFTGIINSRTANFVKSTLDTNEKREMVFKTWTCLKELDPDIKSVQSIINDKNLFIHLFFGRHDKLIPPSIGKKFLAGLKNKNLHIVEGGHQLITDKLNADLMEIISK